MPAEIEQMFSVREMPWHRQGQVPDDYPQNFEEARKLAGLEWDPVPVDAVEQVMTNAEVRQDFLVRLGSCKALGLSDDETANQLMGVYQRSLHRDPEFRRIARSDNHRSLSYQRDSYNIIPNGAFGEIIDSMLEAEPDTVKLETGGCLAGGRKVWMLARLDEPFRLPGDGSFTFPFLGITSSHDGLASCAARLTTVRIVCGNTFARAEAEGQRTGAVYSFSHRGDWRARMGEAREALMYARKETRDYTEAMSELAGIRITRRQEKLFLAEFIAGPPDGVISDRVARNMEEARAAVRFILDGPTIEGSGIRGTALGLVQAAGEYADHIRIARTWESRVNRTILKPEPLKAKAAQLAREAALA